MQELVSLEEEILSYKDSTLPDELLIRAKKDGFSDRYLAKILGKKESQIREKRIKLNVVEGWDAVPVSGVDNSAYYYSSYNIEDKSPSSNRQK